MKKKLTADTKLKQPILALTSGVLINSISSQLFPSSYAGSYVNGILQFDQISDLASWLRMSFILVASFFLIWWLLSGFMSLAEKLATGARYRNKPHYTRKQLINTYNDVKEKIKVLPNDMSEYHDDERAILYLVDIAVCIHSLYTHFCPKVMYATRIRNAAFRGPESVADIGKYISPYEFEACLELLGGQLNTVCADRLKDPFIMSDKVKLDRELTALKEMVEKLREK